MKARFAKIFYLLKLPRHRDVPNAEVHIVDGGHFALDTAADEIAALVDDFVSSL
jgi:pimeloyl-ACP methyl ester carboxylesterase